MPGWVGQLVFFILLLVLAYTTGHLVAYAASHIVEGFVKKTLGSFSEIVILSTEKREDFEIRLVESVIQNKKKYFKGARGSLTWLAHAPFGLWYWIFLQFSLFNSVDTRIPRRMMEQLEGKLQAQFDGGVSTKNKNQWFRWVEYSASYNCPRASASMYNYLVISGFMRSVSFLFLVAAWAEIAHLLYAGFAEGWVIHSNSKEWGWLLNFGGITVGFLCSITAYVKFFRRYVEEAILGYLLEDTACGHEQPRS